MRRIDTIAMTLSPEFWQVKTLWYGHREQALFPKSASFLNKRDRQDILRSI